MKKKEKNTGAKVNILVIRLKSIGENRFKTGSLKGTPVLDSFQTKKKEKQQTTVQEIIARRNNFIRRFFELAYVCQWFSIHDS
jgi:hypothetical protein